MSNPLLTLADVRRAVSSVFNTSFANIGAAYRIRQRDVPAMRAYCYLARQLTERSYGQIANTLNRNHKTVVFHERAGQCAFRSDKNFCLSVKMAKSLVDQQTRREAST